MTTAVRPVCKVEGCTDKHRAKGYCGRHYRTWLRGGDPIIRIRRLSRAQIVAMRRLEGIPDDGPTPEMVARWTAQEDQEDA